MSSWRDIASQPAHEDLDGLVGVALDFARQQLGTRGEFFPFAVAVGGNGAIEIIDARLDTADEHPPSAEVLAVCVASLRSKRAGIRACATAADVTLDQPRRGDAIRVDLEHAEGHALTVDLPYTARSRPTQAHTKFGNHQIGRRVNRVWPTPSALPCEPTSAGR